MGVSAGRGRSATGTVDFMGFPLATVAHILQEHAKAPFPGPVLTLGRQYVDASYANVLEIFEETGIEPLPIEHDAALEENPAWVSMALFAHLGLELRVLDLAERERPDVLHDLNQPLPDELRHYAGTVIDGGTIEHVFDVRTAFRAIADLARPGGRIMHITPCNNYVNHGFWQLSPTAFFDFYGENGFDDLGAMMLIHSNGLDYRNEPFLWFRYDERIHGGINSLFSGTTDQLATVFSCRKGPRATSDRIPMQRYFRNFDAEWQMQRPRMAIDYPNRTIRQIT